MAIAPTDFTFRQPLTGTSPSASNNGQLLLITEANVHPYFWEHVASGGGAIRVCEDAEGLNQLPVHVLLCDTGLKELKVWVRKPVYSSGSRDLHLFSKETGSALADNHEFGKYNVWQDYFYATHDNGASDSSGNFNALDGNKRAFPVSSLPTIGTDLSIFAGFTDGTVTDSLNIIAGIADSTIYAKNYASGVFGQGLACKFYNVSNDAQVISSTTTKVRATGLTGSLYKTQNASSGSYLLDYDSVTASGAHSQAIPAESWDCVSLEQLGDLSPSQQSDLTTDWAFISASDLGGDYADTLHKSQSDPTTFWTQGQYDFPNQVKYDDVTNAIDGTHSMASMAVAGFLAKGISGNDITETVTQTPHTIAGTVAHNGDGSVTNTDTVSNMVEVDTTTSIHLLNDSFLVFVDGEKHGNNNNTPYNVFKGNSAWNRYWVVRTGTYTGTYGMTVNRKTDAAVGSLANNTYLDRTQMFFVMDGPAGSVSAYDSSILVETNNFTNPNSTTVVGLEIGLGGPNASVWGGYVLHKVGGSFTQAEIDSIIADPYAMFEAGGGGGNTPVSNTSNLSTSFNEEVAGTTTLSAGFHEEVNNPTTLSTSFLDAVNNPTTLSTSFLGAVNNPTTLSTSFNEEVVGSTTFTTEFTAQIQGLTVLSTSLDTPTDPVSNSSTLSTSFRQQVENPSTLTTTFRHKVENLSVLSTSIRSQVQGLTLFTVVLESADPTPVEGLHTFTVELREEVQNNTAMSTSFRDEVQNNTIMSFALHEQVQGNTTLATAFYGDVDWNAPAQLITLTFSISPTTITFSTNKPII